LDKEIPQVDMPGAHGRGRRSVLTIGMAAAANVDAWPERAD
jgi:hypothetical protein